MITKKMKDVCLVAAYTPDQEREDMLRRLTRFLKGKKDIVLISHTPTPKDIIEDVNYHFYDQENELLSVKSAPSFWWYHDIGNAIIWSNDVWYHDNHKATRPVGYSMLPVTRNFFFGVNICKILGYDFVHYIEYDSEIESVDFINSTNELLTEYDGVTYWTENNHPHGAFCSYNLNSYSFDELKWDKKLFLDEFLEILKLPKEGSVENFVFDKMSKNKNILKRELPELDAVLKSCSPQLQGKYDYVPCIFLIRDDGTVTFFGKNTLAHTIKLSVLINAVNNFDFEIKPGFWTLYDIGSITDVKKIFVFLDDVKIKEYDFTTQKLIDKHRENNKTVNK